MTMTPSARYSPVLDRTLTLALEYLDRLRECPVAATATLAELRQRLDRPLPRERREPSSVVEQLVADVAGGLAGSAGGRFFGWVIGGAVPAALAADWLTSTWDQNAGMYAVAPAAAVVEEVCGRWLLELLRLPVTASFALVTGCQMAHVTCLAAARNAVLAKQGWDVEQQGLFGAAPIRVVTGDQRHGTIERALRLLGVGQRSIVDIPVDDDGPPARRWSRCSLRLRTLPRSFCCRRVTSTPEHSIGSSRSYPSRTSTGPGFMSTVRSDCGSPPAPTTSV